ncbi:hypothetical protein TrRE_jg7485 [Triparma retinervis]|uniref:Cyclic nucleotide-binding domain-containing protein n=1 Tax=Triparma retinervis TaxID=2557542 RepID=A0A9W7DN65_9STRA|nr:hypothetical protein TrRE_jg7485 [Triparma retinervis]
MERALADETAGAFNNMINPKSPTNEGNRPRANSNTKRPMSYAMADQIRQKGEKAKEKVAERGQTYIHPKNKTKIRWDMYCGALIIYSVCVIPWRIGFEVEAEGLILYFDYCVDICFAFDMLFCFFTAYYDEEMLIVDLPNIRSTYLKTWFMPDLLSTVPVDKVAEIIIGGPDGGTLATAAVNCTDSILLGAGGGGGGNELAGFRLIRILRLARLLKLMRLLKLSKKGSNVDMNEFINPAIRKLLNVLGKIMFIAHLLSCIWFGVNVCEPLAKIQTAEASPCFDPSDIVELDWVMCGKANLLSQYISSFYWTIATMMAVGYGDVSPGSTGERIFGILTQVVGAMSFGLIIATVGIIVDTLNPEATLRKRRLDTLTAFMDERGVTKGLKRQVKDHFEYFYTYKTIFNEPTIFHDLPPTLKAQLVYELRKSDLNCIKFFRDLDLIFVTELVVKLKPMCMQYMQTMGCTGSFNAEAYFITKGKVQGLYPVGLDKMTICGLFKEGDDFEMDTMLTDMVMRCSYRAISVTDLLWMESEDFNELAEEYPACGENVRVHAQQHKRMIEEAISSETQEFPEIGMAQALVVFESNLCKFEDVLASFEVESDLNVSKIRTYRAVMVGEGSPQLSTDDLKKMAKEQHKTPTRSAKKGLAGWASSSKIAPKDPGDEKEGESSKSAAEDMESPGGSGGNKKSLTPKMKQRAMTTGGMPGEKIKFGNTAKKAGEETPEEEPRKTIHIVRRKDSTGSHGKMMNLDTPLSLFAKHGTFRKTTKIIQVQVEETTAELALRYIINPKDGRKISWDLFIGALIIWSVIIVPFRLGFDQEPEPGSVQEYVDIFQDIMFGIDILLCFRVAFLDEQLVYVTEPKEIAKTYFRSWFLIDFLSTFPIDRIIIAAQSGGDDVALDALAMNSTLAGGESGSAARSLKMIKVLRLIRLSKLARLFKLKNLVKGMDEILALSAVAMKALQLVTTLLFIGHLFGCFWSYISANITEMITDDPNRWWHSPVLADIEEGDVGGLYVSSLYWAFTTMTTVGYGDVLPTNDVEKVYATLIMVLGATIFGYIVGSVGALAINVNGAPARRHAKVSMAMNYLAENQLPKYHSVNVKKQILFYLQCKSPFNEDGSLMSFLPREMRREMILQSHKNLIPHIPLFKRQSRDFISFLLTKMRPQMVAAGQTILDSNMGSDGIYFLLHGTARMVIMDKEKQEKVTSVFIEEGRFFGHEIYIEDELTNDETLYRLYNSVKDCELFVLLDIDISHLLESRPSLAKELKLALHQMIRGQPPIKFNTVRARKQRKSMRNFSFGTRKEDGERGKAALSDILAKINKKAVNAQDEGNEDDSDRKKSVSFTISAENEE